MEAERAKRIKKLQKEKDVVILAHYYVDGAVQEIADYVGDSFYLSKVATKVPQKTILFAGVTFMGESAKILNPDKTVVMADECADCPMAHMITADRIAEVRAEYENLAVVCYVNSTAEIKAVSDVCVTSSNAVKVVSNIPQKNIFFVPDNNLGRYVAEKLPEKHFFPRWLLPCAQEHSRGRAAGGKGCLSGSTGADASGVYLGCGCDVRFRGKHVGDH